MPTILYDDPNMPKGYVDITTLEQGTNYRVNSSIVSGFFKVSLKAPNDDGTWFTVDDGSNTIGWSSMLSTSICVQLKSDTFIAINMNCINNYCKYLSITKENGKWKLMQTKLDSISPDNTYEYDVTNDYNPAHKKYVDDNRIGYIKSETVGETIDTSTMINSFNNNSYIYESNNVTYLEIGKEYHVIVNGVRYRALCINNMPGNDQIYETIAVNGDGFSISIMNKMGYNTKYYTDNTKCAYEIKLSDELLAAPPTIQILKMDIEYIPTYLMPKDLEILNSISVNRIGDIGTGSAAIGYKNTASNDFTFAMGIQTTASAPGAHAEGGLTVANASYSHAEGFKSASTGEYSHVEGIVCESSGQGSHAEGYYTVASGQRSHSEGCFTEAASQYQHVQGKYNVVDSNGVYAHIVGNGTGKNNRHNAHTLDWQGNAWYSGKLSQEGTPTDDKDLVTKKYVDDNMKTAINDVKGDLGTDELTTTAKDLRGAVNELNTQCKDIASKTITTEERTKLTSLENYDDTTVKNDIQTQKARIDSLTTLTEGSTTGDAELIDGRTGADGVTYTNIGDAIRTQCGNLNTLLDVKYEPISNNCIDDSKFVGKNFDSIFGHNGNKKFKLAKKLTSNRIKGYIELEDGTTPSTAFQIYLTTSVEGIQGVEDIQLSIGGTLVVSDDFDKFDTISVDCWQIYDKNIKTFFIGNYADEYDNYKTQPKSKALENVDSKISNIPPEQCTFFTKVDNLLKNVNLQKGYGINPNHGMPDKLTGIERTTTDFMELRDDCKSTYCNINGYIYYYDANKKYLQSISPQNLETPAGIVALPQSDTKIKYIRYTFVTEDDAALATYWITDQGKPYENDKLYISKDKIEDMTKTESWYKGKKICAYGDSVTEQNKWQSFVSSYFNCSFYNKGVGGTTVTQINSSTNHMSGDTRIETIPTDSDVVLVFGGHNDWSNASINMGDIKTDALSESTSFKSAFGLMLKKIQTRCPNAKIITMTPVGGRTEEASTNQDKQFYIRDLCMSDFANAVKEVSAYYGIPCIDINANSGINTLNHTTYIADLIHPNLEGGKLIANEVINGLKRFEPIVF